jgi:hypothetical protein
MIPLLRSATLISLRRTAADWRLQVAAGFGMVLAVGLICAGVIYSGALAETTLRNTLRSVPEDDLNMTLRVFHALERPAFDATNRFVEEQVYGPLSDYLREPTLLIQTSTLFFTGLPQMNLANSDRPRGSLQAMTGVEDHARLIQGRWPQHAAGVIEIAIDAAGASSLDLSTEQEFWIYQASGSSDAAKLKVRIAGVFQPGEAQGQYWQMGTVGRVTSTERSWTYVPLYTSEGALLDGSLAEVLPGLVTDFTWLFPLDTNELNAGQADRLRTTLTGITNGVRAKLPNSVWRTDLDDVLDQYASLLLLARVPLFLVLFLAVGVLLYYMFLIAGLIGRIRVAEVALLRSRGASIPQVGIVILVEALLMAIPAVIIGPFFALALVALTGRLFPAISGGQALASIGLSPPVFVLGSIGALVMVVVFAVTILRMANKGIVEFRSSSARPPEIPFLYRYYLDVALLVLIGVIWWQLTSRASFFIRPVSGDTAEIDLTLFLGPVLGSVAIGLVLLRLFPFVVKVFARLMEPVAPPWLVHSLHRVSRDPVPSGSLIVLLALATSLGVLGSAVIATLERSQREQALYQAGADVRINYRLRDRLVGEQGLASALVVQPEVAAATDVVRMRSRVITDAFGQEVDLLLVDSGAFPEVAWARPDFVEKSLTETLDLINPDSPTTDGIPIPVNATALGIWVQPGQASSSVTLLARLVDSRGTFFDTVLGGVSDRGWQYIETSLPLVRPQSRTYTQRTLVSPFTLHTLWIGSSQGSGAVFLDGLQAITPSVQVLLESFQNVDAWHTLEDYSAPGTSSLDVSEAVARIGGRSAVFTWGGGGVGRPGIQAGSPDLPLPALVSPSFLKETNVQVGDVVSTSVGTNFVPMKVAGVAEFFPTLDPRKTPFMVADMAAALRFISLRNTRPLVADTEVWIRSNGEDISLDSIQPVLQDLGGTILESYLAVEMVAESTGDPLLTSGWSGLLALSFLAVVMASSSGLILYTYIDARERLGEFAILRALGFTTSQVNGVVWFNLALTVVLGMSVGALGGHWLGNAVLPLLEVGENSTRVTPPLVLQNNWLAVGLAYLVLAASALVTVASLAWAIGRMDIQRILRVVDA